MYVAELIVDEKHFKMSVEDGVLINTIKGLTGATARLSAVANPDNVGEVVDNGYLGGNQISIQGTFLDGNTAKRRELQGVAVPLKHGRLVLYDIVDSYSRRYEAYRWTDVVVARAPQFANAHHGKFVLTLYQPVPVWYPMEPITEHLLNGGYWQMDNPGDVSAEFEVTVTVESGSVEGYVLNVTTTNQLFNQLALSFSTPLTTGDVINLKCKRSGVSVIVNDIPDNSHLDVTRATTEGIQPGQCTISIQTGGTVTSVLTYYPAYVGVVLDVG